MVRSTAWIAEGLAPLQHQIVQAEYAGRTHLNLVTVSQAEWRNAAQPFTEGDGQFLARPGQTAEEYVEAFVAFKLRKFEQADEDGTLVGT